MILTMVLTINTFYSGNFDLVHPNQRDEKQNSKSFEILFYIAVVIIFGLTTLLLTKRYKVNIHSSFKEL